jgi:hypothetical protein
MVERAAPRHRSVKPEAANGGGPKGQALQTDGGEQTIELAIGQRRTTPAAAPPALRHGGQLFAIYARIVRTADMSFSELRIVWGRSGLIGTAGFVIVVDQVEQLHIVVVPDQLPEFIEQFDDREGAPASSKRECRRGWSGASGWRTFS